jgi:hypothetical protein
MRQAQQTSMSVVFRNFNRLNAIARTNPVLIDLNYLKHALGEAQKTLRTNKAYFATQDACTCEDMVHKNRADRRTADGKSHYSGPCKHRLEQMLRNPNLDPDQALQSILQEATSRCRKRWQGSMWRRGRYR